MTPEQIAAKLSPAQKRALLWLPGDGARRSMPPSIVSHTASWLTMMSICTEEAGLAEAFVAGLTHDRQEVIEVRATRRGLAVRRIIEQQEATDA